jgi:glycine betaine catabolism A
MNYQPAPIDHSAIETVLAPFGSSRTLPAEAYRSAELFAWEQQHLFAGSWVCLGRSAGLVASGQVRGVEVGGESVAISRDRLGELRAFSNVCRHRGHQLVEEGEAYDLRLIRCPYHSWSYTLDGSLRSAPTFTRGEQFDPADYPLIELPTAEWQGWLWINLSGDASPLAAHLGNIDQEIAPYRPSELVVAARHHYEVAANWKLIVENYHECYHCSSIHPALCRLTPVDSGVDFHPTGLWCGGTMELKDHAETMSVDGRSGGVFFTDLSPTRRRQVIYVGLFPNLLLSAHPDYLMTHRLTPVSVDRTRIECEWLFPPGALSLETFDPAYAVDFWDITNGEDWAACEGVQRGIRNRGHRPGPLSSWETTVYQFLQIIGNAYFGRGLIPPLVPEAKKTALTAKKP